MDNFKSIETQHKFENEKHNMQKPIHFSDCTQVTHSQEFITVINSCRNLEVHDINYLHHVITPANKLTASHFSALFLHVKLAKFYSASSCAPAANI